MIEEVESLRRPEKNEDTSVYKILVNFPEYYYDALSKIAPKYGGINGAMIYAARRFVTKHKKTKDNPRRRKYSIKIDGELKKELMDRVGEYFITQNQSFLQCIIEFLAEEGAI